MNIGEKIKYFREKKGYYQKDLADMIHVHERTIGHYEAGRRSPSVDMLQLLAQALEIHISDFFTVSSEKEIIEEIKDIVIHDDDYLHPEERIDRVYDIISRKYKQNQEPKEHIVKINKNMDRKRFKSYIKELYHEVEFTFIENAKTIQVYNETDKEYGFAYDKQLAEKLLTYTNETTVIKNIYHQPGHSLTINGTKDNGYFSIHVYSCSTHGFHFDIRASGNDLNHFPPIIEIVHDWFIKEFQPKHIHYYLFARAYFSNFSKKEIESYRIDGCEEFLYIRSFNALKRENMLQIGDILKLSKNEVHNLRQIGNKSANEVINLQTEIREWMNKYVKE